MRAEVSSGFQHGGGRRRDEATGAGINRGRAVAMGGSLEGCGEGLREGGDGCWGGWVGGGGGGGETVDWEAVEGDAEAIVQEGREGWWWD